MGKNSFTQIFKFHFKESSSQYSLHVFQVPKQTEPRVSNYQKEVKHVAFSENLHGLMENRQ